MKKEARLQAQNMYLKAGGKITNRDIAKSVHVNALTIGRWKRDENWDAKLPQDSRGVGTEKGGIIRKKGAKDKALKLYMDASGNITNKDLALRVGVSPATISKWKDADNWISRLLQLDTNGENIYPESVVDEDYDLGELVSPDQIVKINRRIDNLLKRDYLSAGEIADLAEAKSGILDAVEVYLTIAREVGEMRVSE